MKIGHAGIKTWAATRLCALRQRIKGMLTRIFVTGPENDTEFLPGALEVTANPPSPIGRAIIWTIVIFVVGAILWASLSKIEVVAIAQGKLVPVGEVKAIQPLEPGVIREIAVIEGQHVEKGQLLVSLDPTASEADELSIKERLKGLRYEMALFNALLSWEGVHQTRLPDIVFPEGTGEIVQQLYNERLNQEIEVLSNTLSGLKNEMSRMKAQEQRTKINIKKYTDLLAIDEEISKTYKRLYSTSASSRHQWLMSEQTRIKTEQDRAQILEQLEEIAATQKIIDQEISKTLSTFRSDTLRKKSETETSITIAEQDLAKATKINTLRLLYSPASGYVQQLAVHTLGGVVQSGDTLMVIVPDGTELHLKVNVMNKDIGFISSGQKSQVKLEAFPFTEYGMLEGEVLTVSADAVQNKNGELLFPCTIALKKNKILVAGKPVELRPGMAATGEIILRKRRLISYFLSPLLKLTQESLRER